MLNNSEILKKLIQEYDVKTTRDVQEMLKDFKFKSVFSLDDSLHKSLYLANIDIPL